MKHIQWKRIGNLFKNNDLTNNKTVITTPIGNISRKIYEDEFNFIAGHTDFDIGTAHREIIKNVSGVEIVHVLTPYQFVISVGKVFETKKVLKNIKKALGCSQEEKFVITPKTKSEVLNFKNTVSKNKFWAIYILPNGSVDSIGTDNNKEFLDTYLLWKDIHAAIGGKLLSPTQNKTVY